MAHPYSDPATLALVNGMYQNVQDAAHIMTRMQNTLSMARRKDDLSKELKPAQRAVIAKNQGKHIYSPSHPLYKESSNV